MGRRHSICGNVVGGDYYIMHITTKRSIGRYIDQQTGEQKSVESATLYVLCDGERIGRTGLKDKDVMHLVGIPSESLMAALKEQFPAKRIAHPSVLLNKDGDPLDIYGEGGGEEEDDENQEEDDD